MTGVLAGMRAGTVIDILVKGLVIGVRAGVAECHRENIEHSLSRSPFEIRLALANAIRARSESGSRGNA